MARLTREARSQAFHRTRLGGAKLKLRTNELQRRPQPPKPNPKPLLAAASHNARCASRAQPQPFHSQLHSRSRSRCALGSQNRGVPAIPFYVEVEEREKRLPVVAAVARPRTELSALLSYFAKRASGAAPSSHATLIAEGSRPLVGDVPAAENLVEASMDVEPTEVCCEADCCEADAVRAWVESEAVRRNNGLLDVCINVTCRLLGTPLSITHVRRPRGVPEKADDGALEVSGQDGEAATIVAHAEGACLTTDWGLGSMGVEERRRLGDSLLLLEEAMTGGSRKRVEEAPKPPSDVPSSSSASDEPPSATRVAASSYAVPS